MWVRFLHGRPNMTDDQLKKYEVYVDSLIRDLRYQVSALRQVLEDAKFTDKEIDAIQYKHRKIES